jgi:hypothetical protein
MWSTSMIQAFQGGTKETFGRVFCTEGKSLVFYAYNLSALGTVSQANTPTTFGGNKDGNLVAMRNLGTLEADDPSQKRWKLQVDGSKVLADIDRVFVTVEPVRKLGPRPHGKRFLEPISGVLRITHSEGKFAHRDSQNS